MNPTSHPSPDVAVILQKLAAVGITRPQLKKAFDSVKKGYGLRERCLSGLAPRRKQRKTAGHRFDRLCASLGAFRDSLGPDFERTVVTATDTAVQASRKALEQLDLTHQQEAAALVVSMPLGAQNLVDLCLRLKDHSLLWKELAVLVREFLPDQWKRRYAGWSEVDAVSDYETHLRKQACKFQRQCRKDPRVPNCPLEVPVDDEPRIAKRARRIVTKRKNVSRD